MENIRCNTKERNILSRGKKSNFRKSVWTVVWWEWHLRILLPLRADLPLKLPPQNQTPRIWLQTFDSSLLTRCSSQQHGFRLSNLNFTDRIPPGIFNNSGKLDSGFSDAAFVTRHALTKWWPAFEFPNDSEEHTASIFRVTTGLSRHVLEPIQLST